MLNGPIFFSHSIQRKCTLSVSCLTVSCMVVLCLVLLAGCGAHVYHRVEPGETLYSIGWIYGYDYRQIAEWNDIPAPYVLTPGRELRLAPPSGHAPAPLVEDRKSVV